MSCHQYELQPRECNCQKYGHLFKKPEQPATCLSCGEITYPDCQKPNEIREEEPEFKVVRQYGHYVQSGLDNWVLTNPHYVIDGIRYEGEYVSQS